MRRFVSFMLLAGLAVFAANAVADKASQGKPKTVTLQGEIVDMGCYLGQGARGEKHRSCATKCIAGGMPMGLLTAKNKLYLLTLNHDDAAPYQQSKELAGSTVEITGALAERDGISAIDVAAVKPVTRSAGK